MEKIKVPKRESGIARVIAEPDDEKAALEYFKRLFDNPETQAHLELPKTPELVEAYEEINHYLQSFIKKYGGRALNLRPEHLHLIDLSKVTPEQAELLIRHPIDGRYIAAEQAMYIFLKDQKDPRLKLIEGIVHEMLHFQVFDSFELSIEEGSNPAIDTIEDIGLRSISDDSTAVLRRRRAGLSILSKTKGKTYLREMEEALISELIKRFARQYYHKIKYLAKELEQKREFVEQMPLMEQPAYREETSYVEKVQQDSDGSTTFAVTNFAYPEERGKLQKLIEDIYQKKYPAFTTREEIFEIFARASVTGRLLPLARLFEKTYGRHGFIQWAEQESEKR